MQKRFFEVQNPRKNLAETCALNAEIAGTIFGPSSAAALGRHGLRHEGFKVRASGLCWDDASLPGGRLKEPRVRGAMMSRCLFAMSTRIGVS